MWRCMLNIVEIEESNQLTRMRLDSPAQPCGAGQALYYGFSSVCIKN